MGLFSRKPEAAAVNVGPAGPFAFCIDDVFTITGKGRMFTGIVESGRVDAGAPASLVIGDRVLPAQIGRLEVRGRRKPVALNAGESGAIGLDGVVTDDLPLTVYGGQMIVDTAALKGALIRSRLESDFTPPTRGD